MVSLKITDEIVKKHRDYLLNDKELLTRMNVILSQEVQAVLKGKGDSYLKENNAFFKWISSEYEKLSDGDSIFVEKPRKLLDKVRYVEKSFPNISAFCKSSEKIMGDKTYSDLIIKALGYETFSDKKPVDFRTFKSGQKKTLTMQNYAEYVNDSAAKWSAYNFVMELGLKVCPYCNRSFITPIYSIDGKARGDLDHFLPKSQYPYLSMSLYNLIPCCKICNSSFKNTTPFSFEDNLNLYEEVDVEELYRFTYSVESYDAFYGKEDLLKLEINYDSNDEARRLKNNNEMFQIEEIYQYHTHEVQKLLLKRIIYTDEYIDSLFKSHRSLFNSRKEVISLLTDTDNAVDIKNSILGKLKKDIAEEIGFDE